MNQKRAFFRVDVPDEKIGGLAIWLEKQIPRDGEDQLVRSWGRPDIFYSPADAAKLDNDRHADPSSIPKVPFKLTNLSAQGLRVEYLNLDMNNKKMGFHLSQYLIALLDLYDFPPEDDEGDQIYHNKRIRFWLRLQVKSRFEGIKTTEVGLKIVSEGHLRPTDNNEKIITWAMIDDQGAVNKLGDWVMKLHMEQYRATSSEFQSAHGRDD
jgi:hypothetical protein